MTHPAETPIANLTMKIDTRSLIRCLASLNLIARWRSRWLQFCEHRGVEAGAEQLFSVMGKVS